MMEQAARRAKDLVRLTDVLARYNLTPNRAGFLHCPFHSGDRDASLKIYPTTDSWYCFGCGEGGDVIDFVAKMERCGFAEAVKRLNTDFCLGLEEKQSLRNVRQRKQERAREVLKQKAQRDILLDKIAYRRTLWLSCKDANITTHERAQRAAQVLAKIDQLDEEIAEMGDEDRWS